MEARAKEVVRLNATIQERQEAKQHTPRWDPERRAELQKAAIRRFWVALRRGRA